MSKAIHFLIKMLSFGLVLLIVRSPILMLLVGIVTGIILGLIFPDEIQKYINILMSKLAGLTGMNEIQLRATNQNTL